MTAPAQPRRAADLPRLGVRRPAELDASFDLVVVGGGITGAGVARHAAQAGLRTLVLDAADFAAGTSSRSSKLIHGGLRYLAMGELALVREGALERKSLRAMAPHLAEPRWMVVPARSRLQLAKLRLGIGLYERLGAVARHERHRNWDRAQLAAEEPLLDRARLPWACVYREYLTDDARLVLATLRAAVGSGAEACNHARVVAVSDTGGGCRVTVLDQLSGEQRELHCRVLVNAAGPWVETLLAAQDGTPQGEGDRGGRARRLHLSKGVHVVLEHRRLPVRHPVMMTARDGRPVFVIPRGGVSYVGTTDTSFAGGPEHWPEVSPEDVAYLLETGNAHFDLDGPLTEGDVVAAWAGLRPLIHQPGRPPKEMSRRDEIWRRGAVITIAGGKLTGFRKMADQAMTAVEAVLGRSLAMSEPLAPLPGGAVDDLESLVAEVARRHQLEAAVAERLVRLYGSEVTAVLGVRPTPLSASAFAEEVAWAVEVEGARRLEDVLYRRLRAAWFLPAERDELIQRGGRVMAERLGWDDGRLGREREAVRARLDQELAFRRVTPPSAERAGSGRG